MDELQRKNIKIYLRRKQWTKNMYIYLKKTKHGYEIAVVGESENTARYAGIDVKKVIIRTMLLSGAMCGIAGLLLVGGTDHTITTTTADNRGFYGHYRSMACKI